MPEPSRWTQMIQQDPAVGDGVDFEESRLGFDLVAGFTDGDRVTQ